MNETNSPKENDAGRLLPSRHLRWITLMIMLPVVFLWSILAVPGKKFQMTTSENAAGQYSYRLHGWPAIHFECVNTHLDPTSSPIVLTQQNQETLVYLIDQPVEFENADNGQQMINLGEYFGRWEHDADPRRPYWMELGNWSHVGEKSRINWGGLGINLLIFSIGFSLIYVLLFRRLRQKLFQVSIFEFGVVVLLFSLWFGFRSGIEHDHHRRDSLEALESVKLYQRHKRMDTEPEWLVRMVGKNMLPVTEHFRNVVFDYSDSGPQEWEALCDNFKALRFIRTARIANFPSKNSELLGQLSRVNQLTLITPMLKGDDWQSLSKMTQVHQLRILGEKDTRTELSNEFFETLSKLESLEQLVLEDCQFDSEQLLKLVSLDRVESFSLTGSPVGPELVEMAVGMSSLYRLELADVGVKPEWREGLEQKCPRLQVFYGR